MKLKALIQKEFQRFFRDPKLIATLVLPGVLIYFIYSLLGSAIWGGEKNYSYDVLVYGSSPKVEALFEGSFGESPSPAPRIKSRQRRRSRRAA